MFINSFGVKNFMIHRDSKIELFPITVLVGHNGGGKSALFDALLNFSMVSRGNIPQAFGPWPYSLHARKHHGTTPTSRISFDVEMAKSRSDHEKLRYKIEYSQHSSNVSDQVPSFAIQNEQLLEAHTGQVIFDRSDPDSCEMTEVVEHLQPDRSFFAAVRRAQAAGTYRDSNALTTYCARQISRFNKFRLDPTELARPGRLPEISTEDLRASRVPRIDYRGEDLAAVLYYLSESNSPLLGDIVARVADVVTGLEGFEFNKVGADRIGFSARFADPRGVVPAAHISDGVLTLIGLLVLVATPDRPPVLCIEEPENGLTPRATRTFYGALRELALGDDVARRSQVLVSSHSPFVICEAWNGEDRDFIYQVRPQEGRAVIRPFSKVVEDEGIQLSKEKESGGKRTHLSLNLADQIMAGVYS